MNIKKAIILIIIFLATWVPTGCAKITEPTTIGDLAYDVNERFGYTVYIKESDGYKPFLVLTNKYNGNTLLLRKYILPEPHIFNPFFNQVFIYMAYYENSEIDRFINSEYKETLDEAIQNMIVPSTIVITSNDSLKASIDEETLEIVRDVFLLSVTEIGKNKYSASLVEGNLLKYFEIVENRLASYETGNQESWWLRTPSNYDMASVFYYSYDTILRRASLGGSAPDRTNGVRPAFCVDKNEPITERDDIISGEVVYVLE